MFDTHCHLQAEQFNEDRDDVIAASKAAGVELFLVPNIDRETVKGTMAVIEDPAIYGAMGVHPHSAKEWNEEVREELSELLSKEPKLRAVGEIGLDYYYDFAPRDVQIRAFEEQIDLAIGRKLPIIVHTRDSDEDVWQVLKSRYSTLPLGNPRGQLHCFSGSVESMARAVDLGFYISFTGNITFKKSTLSDVVRETPMDRILIETDSPYLAPHPHRGKRNTPAFLNLVAEKVAEIKGIETSIVIQQTFQNAKNLFLSSLALLLFCLLTSNGIAQPRSGPVGNQPPDSVMTRERREQEEILRKQREALQQEQERRRADSVRAAIEEQDEAVRNAHAQVKADSARAAERIAAEERARLKALTPVAWKAIGIGGGLGVGNMGLSQAKSSITPTSVLSKTLQIGGQITRAIDIEASYSTMTIEDKLGGDSIIILGGAGVGDRTTSFPEARLRNQLHGDYSFIKFEDLVINTYSLDVRFLITPRNAFKFYAGLGYSSITMSGHQNYDHYDSTSKLLRSGTVEESFKRGAIKVLFGVRYDVELDEQFTLTPFAQISALGALSGPYRTRPFVFNPDVEQITMTHLNVGASLFFGWFSVERPTKR